MANQPAPTSSAGDGKLSTAVALWMLDKLVDLLTQVIIPGLVGLAILLYRYHAADILVPPKTRYRRSVHVVLRCMGSVAILALLMWPLWAAIVLGAAGATLIGAVVRQRVQEAGRLAGRPRRVRAKWGQPIRTTRPRRTVPAAAVDNGEPMTSPYASAGTRRAA